MLKYKNLNNVVNSINRSCSATARQPAACADDQPQVANP
jgi:hypothetical protein